MMHWELDCPRALVQCEFCNMRGIPRGRLHAHLEQCAASANISDIKKMHDKIQILSEQVIGLQAQMSSVVSVAEWQIQLPNQILDLPIGENGYWTRHVHGIWLMIYPKGFDAKGKYISVFVCPSMPIQAEIHIKIGDIKRSVKYSWKELLLSSLPLTNADVNGWYEFMTTVEAENTDEVYLHVVANPGNLTFRVPERDTPASWCKKSYVLAK